MPADTGGLYCSASSQVNRPSQALLGLPPKSPGPKRPDLQTTQLMCRKSVALYTWQQSAEMSTSVIYHVLHIIYVVHNILTLYIILIECACWAFLKAQGVFEPWFIQGWLRWFPSGATIGDMRWRVILPYIVFSPFSVSSFFFSFCFVFTLASYFSFLRASFFPFLPVSLFRVLVLLSGGFCCLSRRYNPPCCLRVYVLSCLLFSLDSLYRILSFSSSIFSRFSHPLFSRWFGAVCSVSVVNHTACRMVRTGFPPSMATKLRYTVLLIVTADQNFRKNTSKTFVLLRRYFSTHALFGGFLCLCLWINSELSTRKWGGRSSCCVVVRRIVAA